MSKIQELWRKFGVLATPETREKMRTVIREIEDRGLTDMRDKSVAHIIDRESDSPPRPEADTAPHHGRNAIGNREGVLRLHMRNDLPPWRREAAGGNSTFGVLPTRGGIGSHSVRG